MCLTRSAAHQGVAIVYEDYERRGAREDPTADDVERSLNRYQDKAEALRVQVRCGAAQRGFRAARDSGAPV